MAQHPELAEEQAYLDRAYACLEESRRAVLRLRNLAEPGRGGTHQARYERDVIEDEVRSQLADLELDHQALIFGRIDRHVESDDTEAFHIGRLAVADSEREPVVVDWRAPVAEPFYRATGRHPMGLARRRHFAVSDRVILDLEDELFGAGHLGIVGERPDGLRGYSSLIAALERSRSCQLNDIVATIQAEQDEIIRAPQPGVLVVQGGPGTGKTVVALHRAAYLLYTHRFPLEDQGVLVIGPNRVFLRYIERVLPSLGEAGVELAVLSDLVPGVEFGAYESNAATARLKGDARMAAVLAKAVRDRERPLKTDLVVGFGTSFVRLSAEASADIVSAARRRFRRHNAARKFVEAEFFSLLAASAREPVSTDQLRERLRTNDDVRVALERMWPVLTPAELLHDLYGSMALLRLAAGTRLTEAEVALLYRARSAEVAQMVWTEADTALLDEALELLGGRPGRKPIDDDVRTYGHIVIDEVQDLTPMQLRMSARRSLNGSMTIVGDLAQATGPFAPARWEDVLRHLPDRREPRLVELTMGYRIPGLVMDLAAKVLARAMPHVAPPTSVRSGERAPNVVYAGADLLGTIVQRVRDAAERVDGSVAVIVPQSLVALVDDALAAAHIAHGSAARTGLTDTVTVVPVALAKGLELDATVVVEPARIVSEEPQGLRALYVAFTRCTQELTVVHALPMPF